MNTFGGTIYFAGDGNVSLFFFKSSWSELRWKICIKIEMRIYQIGQMKTCSK